MVNVVLYGIMNSENILQRWVDKQRQKQLKDFCKKVQQKVANQPSSLVRNIKFQGLSLYYFTQDDFLFMLAAQSPQHSLRMQNYLRVVADIFYESYDQRKFPTVLKRLMTQINRIQLSEGSQDEHNQLVGPNLRTQKNKLNQLLQRRQKQSNSAFKISAFLFFWIVVLAVYYFWKVYSGNPKKE